MPKIAYTRQTFTDDRRDKIERANDIIAEYQAEGMDLTLRQLYYQFVSRDLIKNNMKEYKRLQSLINDARLAGLIDWDTIVDRTRNLRSLAHWDTPGSIIQACATQYRLDFWADQKHYPEVWIEKDALVGVIETVCTQYDIPYFSCRGYTSQSEVWGAAMRLERKWKAGQKPVIFHLGDTTRPVSI